MNFTGYKWWQQKNEPYKECCFKKAVQETVDLKCKYDYFIKQTNEKRKSR